MAKQMFSSGVGKGVNMRGLTNAGMQDMPWSLMHCVVFCCFVLWLVVWRGCVVVSYVGWFFTLHDDQYIVEIW